MSITVPCRRFPDGPPQDVVVEEEPLEIRVEGQLVAITMRTPGDDLDLVAGFLWTEGVVEAPDDLRAMAAVGPNTVDVRLAEGVPPARARSADRQLYATSSCGICGTASLNRLFRQRGPIQRPYVPADDLLSALAARLDAAQLTFAQTGGLHAAARFDATGKLDLLREDVGRHNAVDKVFGAALRADDIDFAQAGLVVTSRAGFEIVQKAWSVGIPTVVTMGAPTSLAIAAAARAGITLIGWLRPGRFTVYDQAG